MRHPVGGDPASLSSLAATLVRVADALGTHGSTLGTAEDGPLLSATVRGLHESGRALRVCAGALQDYAVDLQHARALAAQPDDADEGEQHNEADDARRLARRVAEPVRALRATSDAVASAVRTATGR